MFNFNLAENNTIKKTFYLYTYVLNECFIYWFLLFTDSILNTDKTEEIILRSFKLFEKTPGKPRKILNVKNTHLK